jgi:quercetin 2,3-dioxygenase
MAAILAGSRPSTPFAVSPKGNPANGPLGALVVWNDDEIAPGTGFRLHGHANMEIISYVREGIVTHRDGIGNIGRTEAGDVQAPARDE